MPKLNVCQLNQPFNMWYACPYAGTFGSWEEAKASTTGLDLNDSERTTMPGNGALHYHLLYLRCRQQKSAWLLCLYAAMYLTAH
eukprot:COSAG06_NODE_7780_length_2378_cov_4.945590_4_plen_84_part_00